MRTRTMAGMVGASTLAAGLALSACGSSTSGSATGTTVAGASTTASASGGASTTDPKFSGSGGADFCSYVKQINNQQALLSNIFSSTATPDQIKKSWDDLDGFIDQLVAKAPAEINPDVTTLRDGYAQIRSLFEQYGYNYPKLFEALQADSALAAKFQLTDDPKFAAAGDRIEAYNEKVCGITPTTTT